MVGLSDNKEKAWSSGGVEVVSFHHCAEKFVPGPVGVKMGVVVCGAALEGHSHTHPLPELSVFAVIFLE